jgi:UDP-3-O-[3-hydroxymyristoyl] glucosamine N-acyltransferase
MPDHRFFRVAGPFSLGELARIAGAELGSDSDTAALLSDVATLDRAGPADVVFLDDKRYLPQLSRTRAGACLLRPAFAGEAPRGLALLLTDAPQQGFACIAEAFYPRKAGPSAVHPSAVVAPSARIGEGSSIAAGAVIGEAAEIGKDCSIGANALVGDGVVLGNSSIVGAGASLTCCIIGARVIIHSGVRIGQDGFGYIVGRDGHRKVPQLGRVLVGDDVEIGANTTIDRGALGDTEIGSGTKIDNLVQIGHNVRLGRGCVVVAQVGISGSTSIGDFVMIAGQAGLSGHLNVGNGARIGAQSGVMRDIAPGDTVFGYPAMPRKQYMRQVALLARLAKKKEA